MFLALLLVFMAKVETASLIVIWLETGNVACGSGIMKYLHNLVDH